MSNDIVPGIPNFASVQGTILRGGQPTDEGWAWLKANGITRVVKLNLMDDGMDGKAEELGLEVVYCPVDFADQIVMRPNYDTMMKAVDAIQQNTFVHCTHGQDRTGLAIGCFRVLKQGWQKTDAWAEMLQHGFHEELLGLTLFWEWAI